MIRGSKKLIALLLSLALLFSMAGCAGKDKATNASATPTPAATATQAATQAPEATVAPTQPLVKTTVADDYTAFDLGGRHIKVGIWWDYYYDSDNKDISDDPGLSNTETAQLKLDNVRRIEEKYNCTIDLLT